MKSWFLALSLLAASCGAKEEPAPEPPADTDTDTTPVDTDTDTTPVDTDTDPPLVLTEDCTNGMDDDDDLQVDCKDPDCALTCDADSDGYITPVIGGNDCDDMNPTVYPGAPEICDTVDNDCDLLVDDEDPDRVAATGISQWRDADADGFGGQQAAGCVLQPGNVENPDDCDDGDAEISPAAAEVCNHADDDCDLLVDDADPSIDPALLTTFWTDLDKDGAGDPNAPVEACFQGRYAVVGDDCDDTDPAVQACP